MTPPRRGHGPAAPGPAPASLLLSLADDHRRLGETERAREFLDRARSVSEVLGDDAYGALVRRTMQAIATALAEGSTERLPEVD